MMIFSEPKKSKGIRKLKYLVKNIKRPMPWSKELKTERFWNRDKNIHNYQMDIKGSQVGDNPFR